MTKGEKLNTSERLTKVETKLDITIKGLQEVKDSIKEFVESADNKYALKEQALDQEVRLRFVEKAIWIGFGALGLLQITLSILL